MSTSDSVVSAVRKDIARRHCRSITAIDDKIMESDKILENDRILENDKSRTVSEKFYALWQSCEDHGISCHLHHYPKTSSDPEDEELQPEREKALSLANTADVLVLDWNLGQDTPAHALYLLDRLGRERLRFVVIYTQETTVEDVEEELKKKFGQLKSLNVTNYLEESVATPAEETILISSDESPISSSSEIVSRDEEDEEGEVFFGVPIDTGLSEGGGAAHPLPETPVLQTRINCHIENKVFIFIRRKDDVKPPQLLEEIFSCMLQAFPDHLHWAGLEVATKTRELFLSIIAALPDGADGALLYQLLFQEDDEVSQQICDILADELKFQLQLHPLNTVCDKTLKSDFDEILANLSADYGQLKNAVWNQYPDWERRSKDLGKKLKAGQELDEEATHTYTMDQLMRQTAARQMTLDEMRAQVPRCHCDAKSNEFCQYDLEGLFKGLLKNALTKKQTIKSHVAWATARESVLLPPKPTQLEPGYVLRKKNNDSKEPEWLLCVTSACDCLRPSGVGYQFVEGRTRSDLEIQSQGGETQSCVIQQEIIWDASEMRPRPNPLEPSSDGKDPEYELVSSLRLGFSARVIHRVYSHKSRVGVDTSEFLRERRDER